METMNTPKTGRPPEPKSRSFDQSNPSGHALRDAATALGQEAEDVCATIANKADEAAAATGRKIESVADTIRSHTPDNSFVGAASNRVADSLEYGGKYLKEQGVSGMTDDVAVLVKNNPITSLLVGVGVGFLLARATTGRDS